MATPPRLVLMRAHGLHADILKDPMLLAMLKQRVRRIHIGLHGGRASRVRQNGLLMQWFPKHDWEWTSYYPKEMMHHQQTKWGPVLFADGLLGLRNRATALSNCSRTGGS
eukprot:7082316-Prymnesium_polylepis.3